MTNLGATDKYFSATNGNPLLTGIPNPKNEEIIFDLLGTNYFNADDLLEIANDPSQLEFVLDSTFVPTRISVEIARHVVGNIVKGYIIRDPRKPAVWTHFNNVCSKNMTYGSVSPFIAPCYIVKGITAVGKTYIVKKTLAGIPQIIRHDGPVGQLVSLTQIVWIYQNMTTANSLSGLLLALSRQIDSLLDRSEPTYPYDVSKLPSVEVMMQQIVRTLTTHFCGVLVIDEIQRLNFNMPKETERTRNFIIQLLNAGIPVVLAGNPKGLTFMEKEGVSSQMMRRTKPRRIDPAEGINDPSWQELVKGLWIFQLLPNIAEMTKEIEVLLYKLTGGFPDFLASLMCSSQIFAIERGLNQLDAIVISDAAASDPLLLGNRDLIQGFVTHNVDLLKQFSDVDWEYYQLKWSKLQMSNNGSGTLAEHPSNAPTNQPKVDAESVIKRERGKLKIALRKNGSRTKRSNLTPRGKSLIDSLNQMVNKNK